jgi:tetratricopeptide (TPR) repeat protein
MQMLGSAFANSGPHAKAKELFEEAARRFEALGDEVQALFSRLLTAWMLEELGDREASRVMHEENLDRARSLGSKHLEANTLDSLSTQAVEEGRAEEAIQMILDAYRLHSELGDVYRISQTGSRLANAVAATGRLELAASLLSWSIEVRRDIGTSNPWLTELNERTMDRCRTGLDESVFIRAWERGKKLTADDAVAMTVEALRSNGP